MKLYNKMTYLQRTVFWAILALINITIGGFFSLVWLFPVIGFFSGWNVGRNIGRGLTRGWHVVPR